MHRPNILELCIKFSSNKPRYTHNIEMKGSSRSFDCDIEKREKKKNKKKKKKKKKKKTRGKGRRKKE
jgi:hypothetical protein